MQESCKKNFQDNFLARKLPVSPNKCNYHQISHHPLDKASATTLSLPRMWYISKL